MPGTQILGLPYPAESASPDVPRDLLALATSLDGAVLFGSGLLANRPVSTALNPGVAGREYRATDDTTASPTGTTWKDTGTRWETTILSTDPRLPAGTVTVLPASPVDGQEINFLADPTNGVEWHLRYDANAPGPYKWRFKGGPPLYAEVPAFEAASSASYSALGTPGPSITLPALPAGGDFDVEVGALVNLSVGTLFGYMSYDVGVTAAIDTDAAGFIATTPSGSSGQATPSKVRRKTGLAGGATVVAKYKATGASVVIFGNRVMRVTPVRVG